MNFYVTDTHSLFWYLINSPLLGKNASAAFDEADNGNAVIYISAMVLAELFYLNTKLKHPLNFQNELANLRNRTQFVLLPIIPEDISEFDRDLAVSEMHDRIIVGVARRLNAACITKDENITDSGVVKTIW